MYFRVYPKPLGYTTDQAGTTDKFLFRGLLNTMLNESHVGTVRRVGGSWNCLEFGWFQSLLTRKAGNVRRKFAFGVDQSSGRPYLLRTAGVFKSFMRLRWFTVKLNGSSSQVGTMWKVPLTGSISSSSNFLPTAWLKLGHVTILSCTCIVVDGPPD